MADRPSASPVSKLRSAAMSTVAELASGHFAERARQDQASRVILAVRRVGVLQGNGQMQAPTGTWLTRTADAWDPHATTAQEYVELLPPSAVDRILFEGTAWAQGVRPMPTPANEDHRHGRAASA